MAEDGEQERLIMLIVVYRFENHAVPVFALKATVFRGCFLLEKQAS